MNPVSNPSTAENPPTYAYATNSTLRTQLQLITLAEQLALSVVQLHALAVLIFLAQVGALGVCSVSLDLHGPKHLSFQSVPVVEGGVALFLYGGEVAWAHDRG